MVESDANLGKSPPKTGLFLGSKQFGLSVFRTLLDSGDGIEWSILCPDDSADSRSILAGFRNFAESEKLEFFVARTASEANSRIVDVAPDVVFACGWYWLLPEEIIKIVRMGCFGIHNSLLPKYRGWAPLVWSIINGDSEVGASIFKFGSGMDDGDLLHQVSVPMQENDAVADALHNIELRLQQSLPEVWSSYLAGNLTLSPQDHSKASYCGRRQEADGRINWNKPAQELHNFIRAQSAPYPGAFTLDKNKKKITILQSILDPRIYFGTPGQILEIIGEEVVIACGDAKALRITTIMVDEKIVTARSMFSNSTVRFL